MKLRFESNGRAVVSAARVTMRQRGQKQSGGLATTAAWQKESRKKSRGSPVSAPLWALAASAIVSAAGGYGFHRYRWPTEQRCPPEKDRFHEHCKEGRKVPSAPAFFLPQILAMLTRCCVPPQHYVLSLDWSCLGVRRAEVMRAALSLPDDGKPMTGIGLVPSWLTEENAAALRSSPCMKDVELDLACWHCKPTPRTASQKQRDSSSTSSEEAPAESSEPSPSAE